MELIPLTENDIPTIKKWLEDPQIAYYLITEKINDSFPFVTMGIWINKELVGWANLQNIDYDNQKAEYGIAIPNQNHQRLGGIVTRSMLKYGFSQLKLNRIYIRPLISNVKPFPDDVRDGLFIREGVERQSVKRGEKFEDVIVMSITKIEFERKWLKCQQYYHI